MVIAIVGRAITVERVLKKRSKELIQEMKQRRLRVMSLQGAIEKSPILLLQYWKIDLFDRVPKINLHFGGTNNISRHDRIETTLE